MIFTKNKTLKDIVQTQITEDHYQRIETWKAIYSGFYDEFHKVHYQTLNGRKTRIMKSLNMAKIASQELAKMIFTEKVDINISNDMYAENIDDVLNANRFYKIFQSKVENMFALGGLVLKAYPKDQGDGTHKILISYVTPDCFIPITWENESISEGVFLTITKKEDKTYCLFEFHNWEFRKNKETEEMEKILVIKNELYEEDKQGSTAKQVPLDTLYEDLEETVAIEGLTQPLFQYIKPNIANNFDLQSPLGISAYANSLDTLYAIDNAFDSFVREFRLGKRRILVPSSAIRSVVDPETGEMNRYFDADDEAYEAFNFQDNDKQKIVDNTVDLRVSEHVAAINSLLNLFAVQIGFSPGTFTFDGSGVKTATEVVTENSKTFQTKQVNEQYIEEGLGKFIRTIGEVAELYDIFDTPNEDYEIEFYWDDTIIKDRKTDSDFYIKMKNAGLYPAYKALMEIMDMPEEDAKKLIAEVREENKTMNPEMEDIIGGAE